MSPGSAVHCPAKNNISHNYSVKSAPLKWLAYRAICTRGMQLTIESRRLCKKSEFKNHQFLIFEKTRELLRVVSYDETSTSNCLVLYTYPKELVSYDENPGWSSTTAKKQKQKQKNQKKILFLMRYYRQPYTPLETGIQIECKEIGDIYMGLHSVHKNYQASLQPHVKMN